jgi:hypothetical protein
MCRLRRVHVRWLRVLDVVPLLGVRRTSAVIGAPFVMEEPPRTGGPTEIHVPTEPREESCLPEDRDAFHRIEREGTGLLRKDDSLRPSRRLSRSRRPHRDSRKGAVLLMGIARSRCGHPRVRDGSERADTFLTR